LLDSDTSTGAYGQAHSRGEMGAKLPHQFRTLNQNFSG